MTRLAPGLKCGPFRAEVSPIAREPRRRRVETPNGSYHVPAAHKEPLPDFFHGILIRQVHVRGLSAKVGEELARAVRQDRDKNGWATVALMEIRQQTVQPEAEAEV